MIEQKNNDGVIVWKIDKPKHYYEYHFYTKGSQSKYIEKIIFRDYKKKPTGLNNNGYGFARGAKHIFYFIKDKFNKITKFEVGDNLKNSLRKYKDGHQISINKDYYDRLIENLAEVYKNNAAKLKDSTLYNLNTLFGNRYFKYHQKSEYEKNTISNILSEDKIEDELSIEDIRTIAKIVPKLMDKSIELKKEVLNKLLFIDIKQKVNKVELHTIIKDYEKLLSKTTQKEDEWQDFFHKNILILNPGYISMFEKKNVSIKINIPDFLLIDQFQYIDVLEIKRPNFQVLKFDQSHKNYYWSSETVKAISQVENYIYEIENNSSKIKEAFEEEGIDIKIIRPKGIVIIGNRKEIKTNKKALKVFRILNDSMKRVTVIFFDDYLDLFKLKYSRLYK